MKEELGVVPVQVSVFEAVYDSYMQHFGLRKTGHSTGYKSADGENNKIVRAPAAKKKIENSHFASKITNPVMKCHAAKSA